MIRNRGVISAVLAFSMWGALPAFWMRFQDLPAPAIVCHRTLWGLLLLGVVLVHRNRWREISDALRSARMVGWHLASGSLLATNWLLYIWATLHGRILEGALGYYLNPFFNMWFGFLWFGERHGRIRTAAIGIAMAGVALQFHSVSGPPWIALALALTFSLYGVVKKQAELSTIGGLTVETLLLAPFALGWLLLQPSGSMPPGGFPGSIPLLMSMGAATVLPLFLFGHAARSIPLSTLGILQFIGPTIQLAIGWLVYQEPMPPMRLASFGLVWVAIALYGLDRQGSTRKPG